MMKPSLTRHSALLSVYDKTNLLSLAQGLHAQGVKLLGSGGTAKMIREAGIPIGYVASPYRQVALTDLPDVPTATSLTLPRHLRCSEAVSRLFTPLFTVVSC